MRGVEERRMTKQTAFFRGLMIPILPPGVQTSKGFRADNPRKEPKKTIDRMPTFWLTEDPPPPSAFTRGHCMAKRARHDEILARLSSLSNPDAVRGMARFGINPEKTYGVSIPVLRAMAREIGKDHALALRLWSSGVHEARILAGMVDEPDMVTEAQMEGWVAGFDSWDVCDQCCMNLFEKLPFAYGKCVEWSSRPEEFVKRAGFVLMARLAVSDKKAGDGPFEGFLSVILRESGDNRNFVKKAVNWALRQIGKRNLDLNAQAIETALNIRETGTGSAGWIAADAIRELSGKAVQERLKGRKAKKEAV
jgi:3-methyladenine DNA glycosylase AlkD